MAEDLAVLGVKDFQPPDWMREEEDAAGEFGVLAENWQAVNAFLACATQWRHNKDGVPIGLRYEGVEVVLRRRAVEDLDDGFERIRIMEAAAVKEFARMHRT